LILNTSDDAASNNNDFTALLGNRRPTRAQLHLDKVLRDIERIKASKIERSDRRTLEDELKKVKDEQLKGQA